MSKTKYPVIFLLIIMMLVITCLRLPILTNLWNLMTANGYVIPDSSSLFRFSPTLMNEGSGEWWIYGEDDQFYYFQDGVVFDKTKVISCHGFNPVNVDTWCDNGKL